MARVERLIPHDIAGLMAGQGLKLVHKLAAQYGRGNSVGMDESDFVSLGSSVLAEVGPDYDKEHGARFTTYVFPFVDGAMKDEIRKRRHEQRVHGAIKLGIARERRVFASTQSDDFLVLHNTPEETRAMLDDTMSELAARLAGTAVVTANALLQQGTEDGLHEAREHAAAIDDFPNALAQMEPVLQELWQLHYDEGRTLKQYAKAVGVSLASAKLYHKKFKDRLREILTQQGG